MDRDELKDNELMMSEVKYTTDELRQLQLNELEMIVEVDRICRKYGIKYSLDGGTMLGAVRHKGFIPWDDDADIILYRDEYEKFVEACKIDLDTNRFFFQDDTTDPYYRWGYGKMRRLGTEFVRAGQEHMKYRTGVCIDIFPEDKVPTGKIMRRIYYGINYCFRKIMYSELGKVSNKSAFMRIWYGLLSFIPINIVFVLWKKMAKHYNQYDSELICHTMLPNPGPKCKYGMPAESLLGDFVQMEFEGMMFSVSADWDRFLELSYGDYMKMPPEEKRIGPGHPSKFKLVHVTLEEIQDRYNKDNI